MVAQQTKLRIAVTLMMLCAVTPALAQESYDSNCKVISPDTDRGFEYEICRTHVGCDIIARTVAAGCKMKSFVDKVADKFAAKGKLDTEDAEQAAKPDGADEMTPAMRGHAAKMTAEQRARRDAEDHERQMRNSNAANDGPGFSPDQTVLAPKRPGGPIGLFEGNGTAKDGQGILIGEGGMAKGNFKDGKLQGEGEQILPDGTYRGGNYKDGQISGKGFEFGEKDGKNFVTEGTFKADQPDGIVTVTYEDKSSERVRWENGKLIARGPRAAAGAVPEDPKPMSDVQLALAGHAPTDYVIGDLQNGTGIIQRVRKDGTAQFEDWEDGKLMQVGVRAKKGDAISPQIRQKQTMRVVSYQPQTSAEPREVSRDPCASERLSWAGHYHGNDAATIFALENKTSPSAMEPYIWDLNAATDLANRYRGQGVDPLHSPEFMREIAVLYRKNAALLEDQARRSSVQDNQTWNYQGRRTWYSWVACMAEFQANGSRTRQPQPQPQHLQDGVPRRDAPSRRDDDVLPCRTEAEEMLATIRMDNPNRSSWTPALNFDGARNLFLSQITDNNEGVAVLAQFHMTEHRELVSSQAGMGNRAFLQAIHDAYRNSRAMAGAYSRNHDDDIWWRSHDTWIACWAAAEAKRLN